MNAIIKADICVIGAGSGGLSVAAGTAQLGLKTVLIEKAEMGGDCLNTGCVPSKALLAAGKRAQSHRKTDIAGIAGHEPVIDFSAVKDHVFGVINAIAPNDSQERFEGFGVHVIRAAARFIDRNTVMAGDQVIKARYFIVATGSHASVPPITGLDPARVYTNETIFALRDKPDHLVVIGGGPIGLEMAQAHRRLGCAVTVLDLATILPRDDADHVVVVRDALLKEGITLHEKIAIKQVEHTAQGVTITAQTADGAIFTVTGSHLLVAAGRKPNTAGLDLEKAGVTYDHKGITVDARLRSSNKKIFAIGDVCGGPQFTHVAGYHASVIVRNVCFRMPAKVDYAALPWVTYTDPELAQVGLTESAARTQHGAAVRVVSWPFHENDRAIAEGTVAGQIKVIALKNGTILGASVVGPQAGELIALWGLAITAKLKIAAVTGMMAAYPTLSEVSKRAASSWFTPTLFSNKTRTLVRLLQKLP